MENMQPKSFWDRPEGKFGQVFTIALFAGLGYLAYIMLPTIIVLLTNTLYAILLIIAIVAIVAVAADKRSRMLIWYMYKGFLRTLTGLAIQLDPIKILETYIGHLNDQLEKMGKHITRVKSELAKLKGQIQSNEEKMNACMAKAKAAKAKNMPDQASLNARQAERMRTSNEKLAELFNKLNGVYEMLIKIEKNANYLLEDTTNEVDARKSEFRAIKEGHSAFKAAMSVIKGDKDEMEMFNQAMDFVVDDVRTKVGEMERFMEISSSTMRSIDLDNAVFEEKGFQLLEAWEKDSTVLNESSKQLGSAPKNKISKLF